jgi:hypothetical protein
VRVRDGQVLLTDGPAAELREQIGGYTIIDCPDLDDALTWALAMPAAQGLFGRGPPDRRYRGRTLRPDPPRSARRRGSPRPCGRSAG